MLMLHFVFNIKLVRAVCGVRLSDLWGYILGWGIERLMKSTSEGRVK